MKTFAPVMLILIISCLLIFGLNSMLETPTGTVSSTKTQEIAGNYFLYRTKDSQDYLSFLENFDEEKYEIIDISNSMQTAEDKEFYIITYRKKN